MKRLFQTVAMMLAVIAFAAPQAHAQQCEGGIARLGVYESGSVAWGVTIVGDIAYVADGFRGLLILDVSDPAEMVRLGSYDISWGRAYGVAVLGTMAYVVGADPNYVDGKLSIIDVDDSTQPFLLGEIDLPGTARDVAAVGTTAYVVSGSALHIIDVSDPANPAFLATYATPDVANAVTIIGTTAYVMEDEVGLLVLDVSDPANPTLLTSVSPPHAGPVPAYGRNVVIQGTMAYASFGYGSVATIDVRDPTRPAVHKWHDERNWMVVHQVKGDRLYGVTPYGLDVYDVTNPLFFRYLGSYVEPDVATGVPVDVAVIGTTAFMTQHFLGLLSLDVTDPVDPTLIATAFESERQYDFKVGDSTLYAIGTYGLRIMDASDPANPTPLGSYEIRGAMVMDLDGTTLYVATDNFPEDALLIIDAADPANPALLGSYNEGWPNRIEASDVEVQGTTVYLVDRDFGLRIIDASDPANPVLLGSFEHRSSEPDVAVEGSIVAWADGDQVLILDVSNPASPVLLGTYANRNRPNSVTLADTTAYVTMGWDGLEIIDLRQPASPVLLGSIRFRGHAEDVMVTDSTAYVAAAGGLYVLDVSDPASPAMLDHFVPSGTSKAIVEKTTAFVTGASFFQGSFLGLEIYDIAPCTSCYADLDTSTGVGVLDIFDFLAFQNYFVSANPIACDCDLSTGAGVCDVFDFLCFQEAFAAGCP